MSFAPQNELGVVFLFSHLAKKWRLEIDSIQSGYPDCVAYQRTERGRRKIRVEFEFRSRNFKLHGHDSSKCDWLVCWEHNWPGAPKRLVIKELRSEFGLGFNVWIQPVGGTNYKTDLGSRTKTMEWTVSSQAHKGDLILFYETRPEAQIRHIFRLITDVEQSRISGNDWNKRKRDYFATIRRVCTLRAPIHWEELIDHKILCNSSFVRGHMRSRYSATTYWPELYRLISQRNPATLRDLRRFAPENL